MAKIFTVKHPIQKYILSQLSQNIFMRFRDLRTPGYETNLCSYHLKLLIKHQFVRKVESGYTLGPQALNYADTLDMTLADFISRPKTIIMFVIQNSNGDVLLFQRKRQPYIDNWTLPYGKLHIDDKTIAMVAKREMSDKLKLKSPEAVHAGDCYIRTQYNDEVIMSTLAHVFYLETDDIIENERLKWARPHKLSQYKLAPAVEQIVARTFFRDPYFFEEYSEDLLN